MNLLLDTHVFLWWLAGDTLASEAMVCITDPANLVVVSAVSIWEIAVKRADGKLRFEGSIADYVEGGGFESLAISPQHAEQAGALPPHHRDPFDRMLVAQAQLEHLHLVTRNPAFDAYDVKVLRA